MCSIGLTIAFCSYCAVIVCPGICRIVPVMTECRNFCICCLLLEFGDIECCRVSHYALFVACGSLCYFCGCCNCFCFFMLIVILADMVSSYCCEIVRPYVCGIVPIMFYGEYLVIFFNYSVAAFSTAKYLLIMNTRAAGVLGIKRCCCFCYF